MKTSQSDARPKRALDLNNSKKTALAKNVIGLRWRQFWIWLLILGNISILTSDWMAFHLIILVAGGPSLIGTSMNKRYSYLWPFAIALCISLSVTVFGYSFLKKTGVADLLPRLLGQ